MSEKTVVVALGHKALGTTLPEQKTATRAAAKAIADLVEDGANVVISHSNGPQVGMIHTAMNEFGKAHPDYTFAPMSGAQNTVSRAFNDRLKKLVDKSADVHFAQHYPQGFLMPVRETEQTPPAQALAQRSGVLLTDIPPGSQ